ncbi:type III-B CRISPR module-associated protein Cmr3 [Thermaurantimonas aggregans]|uniref:Type III-B CRISPR module-associated protein Cmr3 n=1 Tax=Thermaurantimonas aggregans TaxID=2173829 RepID=A0A401XLY2_9FLAO|nr:type III-B CRISPR module-associated protein Cmr3 [Thermaurantimonas aggregans]MCX8149520.1 type III-B CRISPR module-associated protein Cmr3 [Thermaurantimonas aggregans]GCD78004.1 type III-B CRISPR module-associated protein Cmr3 [Thermaurantimonas aggregans]
MTKKTIHIEAIDTLFFRDGKPFSMGEDVWADGIFPPLPSVIYGALRSAYMFQQGITDPTQVIENTKNFILHNIYLLIDNTPYFTMPLDLVKFKDKDENEAKKIYFLKREPFNTGSNECPEILYTPLRKKVDELNKGILSKNRFVHYLNYNESEIFADSLSKYITSEPKIGIGRDNNSRTTSGEAEGKMYRVNMQRLDNAEKNKLKIAVEYENLTLDDTGIVRFGGENKSVFYKHIDQSQVPNLHLKTENLKSDILRVYLNTPAILENGYCPKAFLNSNDFELLTYAIGKPLFAGGFDMAKQAPKPMYKAVPAGSVYYLKAKNPQQVFEHLYQNNPFNEIEGFEKQGFGKFYIGTTPNN